MPFETWTLRDLDGKVLRTFTRSTTQNATWQKDTVHRQGQVLATVTGGGRRDAFVDHLGTIRLWTNEDGGNPMTHSYHSFGEEIFAFDDGQELRFTGHERDRHRFGDCPDAVVYDDEVIDEGETIVACTVLSSDNTTVDTTDPVRFRAGLSIELDDFTVESGSDVTFELDADLQSDFHDLDYMHARFAKPSWGRFLSVDPSQRSSNPKQPQSWNRYAYTINNPLRLIDPDGEAWRPPDGASQLETDITLGLMGDAGIGPGALAVGPRIGLSLLGRLGLRLAGRQGFAGSVGSSLVRLSVANARASFSGIASQLAERGAPTARFASLVEGVAPATRGGLAAFEQQFAQRGASNLLKSRQSLMNRLVDHLGKIEQAKEAGGFTSSLEREIRTFAQQINAIDQVLAEKGGLVFIQGELFRITPK